MNNQLNTLNPQGGQLVNQVWAEEENYGMVDWIKKCFRNYANFSGRARRKEYWFFYLFFILVYLGSAIIDSVIGANGIIMVLSILGLAIPNLAVSTRRLHDIGKSGWWIIISCVPIVGLVLLVWLATDTKPETNQWGLPARRV